RATVAQQKATGAFMKIQSKQDAKLVSVNTASAEMAEIHEMSMEDQMMKMQQVESIDLPAGKWVELKPGSFHVMLMGLKAQAKENDEISLSLTVETKNKKREIIEVKAKVRALNSGK
ncbi:MAG: copper chaperone PCu(A)C, partial [Undibacterium sp.]|nr:copper chaperone PCu(A)C [Undibacterium sp.]